MKIYLIIVLSFLAMLSAQNIDELGVIVYPEYYYPGVMVEFDGTFASIDESKSFSFMVPTNSDSVFLVKSTSANANDLELLPIKDRNGESWVSIPVTDKEFRVFAFFVPFNPHEKQRTFTYSMKFEDDMANIHLVLNHPAAAENFLLDKTGAEEFDDQHGLSFSRFHIPDLTANTEYTVTVSYTNPTSKTSIQYLQEMLASGGNAPMERGEPSMNVAPKRHTLPIWQPLVMLFAVVGAVGVLYSKNREKSASTMVEEPKSVKKNVQFHYCTECGVKLKEQAKFCHNCGSKV